MSSIRKFGFIAPVLVEKGGEVVAGLARLEAARRLGLVDVPVVRIDHLSRAEVTAYRIADNRLAELAQWDDDGLRDALQSLADIEFDFDAVGFTIGEIDVRLVHPGTIGEAKGEEIAPPSAPVVQRGDLFSIGSHRLLCGDALNPGDVKNVLEGKLAAMVFADPPYNCRINGHASGLGKKRHREFVQASGEMSDADFEAFIAGFLRQASDNAQKGALLFSCIDWRQIGRVINAAQTTGLEYFQMAVWSKNPAMGSFYRSAHELVPVFRKPGAAHRNNIMLGANGRSRSNVWSYPSAGSFGAIRKDLAEHPTPKPVALISDAIMDCTKRGDIIYDPFAGAGPSLIAAEATGRLACVLDLDPGYCEAALRRFERRFGIDAVHVESGLTLSALATLRGKGGEASGPPRASMPPASFVRARPGRASS